MLGTGLVAPMIDRARERRNVVGASCGVSAIYCSAAAVANPQPFFTISDIAITPLRVLYAWITFSVLMHIATREGFYHLVNTIGFLIGLGMVGWMR